MLKRAASLFALVAIVVAIGALAVYGGLFGAFEPAPSPSIAPSPTPTIGPSASTQQPTTTPTPAHSATPRASPAPTDTDVHAQAVVVPLRTADLTMSITGVVSTIFVHEDEQVSVGQLLLRLDQSTYLAQLDVAQAALGRAQAAVDRATVQIQQLPTDATPGQVESAQADLHLAQADLELARSQLAETQAALRQTELHAPIAGTIAAISVALGEQAVAGQTLATIADTSTWLIETTDVTELQIVRVAVGDRATVTFAALPGVILNGHVDRIQIRGTTNDGEVRFAVDILPDVHLTQLRWNMSASVRIIPSG